MNKDLLGISNSEKNKSSRETLTEICFFNDKKGQKGEKNVNKNANFVDKSGQLFGQRSKESLFTAVGSHSDSMKELEREIRGALMGQKAVSSQNFQPEKVVNLGKYNHGSDRGLLK